MNAPVALVLAPLLCAAPAAAQVDYELAYEPGGDTWQVQARLPGRGEPELHFWFPLWTPGAYHAAEFGRFVEELRAADGQGAVLAVERPEPSHFVVRGTAGAREVVLSYEAASISSAVFSEGVIDVESNRIADGYAYVNPVSLFGFVPARASEAVSLEVALPSGWKAATVLERDARGRFVAPGYYRFEDSPLFFAPELETREFEVAGVPHAVTVYGKGPEEATAVAAGCKRIAEAALVLMEGLPYGRYHFLFGFVGEAGGAGLEHSYSTLILLPPGTSVTDDSRGFWDIVAHEYFHLWCAERIHVEGIHHPDLTRPFSTGTLWVNEGVTEYFTRHLLFHAGFGDERDLLASYLDGRSAPPLETSWTGVSRAATRWRDFTELTVFAQRMYMLGPRTIFALDLTMRRATAGERGVLDLLRLLNREYVGRDRGFREDELDEILAAVGGPEAASFHARYIDGKEQPDPAALLDVIGYSFEKGAIEELEHPSEAQLAARRDFFSRTGEP